MSRDKFAEILGEYWGYEDFRGIQREIIQSISAGHDTLGLMPTGGGKSITFQVPALAADGVCLVITPLIALMKDQVNHLRQRGIKAYAIYAGMSHGEILTVLDNCVYGGVTLLYVSPERLSSELFLARLSHMNVSFITIDEAHCISQWGYDFRPAYRRISTVRQLLPDAPILALTATATPRVAEDICRQLQFRPTAQTFQMSFARDNLSYIVRATENKEAELLHILNSVRGSAIIYTRSRDGARELAKALNAAGVSAFYYHAGLTNLDKDVRQKSWQQGQTRVMVATNAFGMGIDKADVRLVIHFEMPDSIEAYYQEAGRAGRDGKRAYAVLLHSKADSGKLKRRINETFPAIDFIRRVYDHLAYYYEMAMGDGEGVTSEFDLERFCRTFRFFPVPVVSALNLLTRAGYLDYKDEDESQSRVLFLLDRDELYRLDTGDDEEILIRALLRNYGGLFSNYTFIREDDLMHDSGLSQQAVYEGLKELTRRRILHYIPRKKVPRITYTVRRLDSKDLVFTDEVYADRKEEYKTRIESIAGYAEEAKECRSTFLLRYFGEVADHDCQHCDICIGRKNKSIKITELVSKFSTILSDGRPHARHEFHLTGIPTDRSLAALQALIEAGEIEQRDGYFIRKQ